MQPPGATWRRGRSSPDAQPAGDGRERSRLCACCASVRSTASAPIVTGLPRGVVSRPGLVAGRQQHWHSALAAPTEPPSLWLWRDGAARVRMAAASRIRGLRRSRTGGMGRASTARAFPAGLPCRAAAAGRRLSRDHVGAWRPGRPDAAQFPARHPDAAGAGLRRADAERARQFRLRPRLHRERRRRAAARQCDRPRARPALARRASGDRCASASASWASRTAASW